MKTKEFAVQVKAAGEDEGLRPGQVKMLVSAFGNVDSYGDVVMAGAFADDLAGWREKGDPIPFVWSHQWRDPFSYVGSVAAADAAETSDGLELVASLDTESNATAAQVYSLLKRRLVTSASFAYDILDASWAEREDSETGKKYEVYELRKLHLIEAGPCLVGANPDAALLAAKAADDLRHLAEGMKASTALPAKNIEALRAAHSALGVVLDGASGRPAGGKASAPEGVEPASNDGDSGGQQQTRARLALLDL